jgi:polysaccharide deacetylase family protein (PEP-CTERM system associated)
MSAAATANGSPPADTMTFRTKEFSPAMRDGRIVNAMSVDVEDYFQVQAFADQVEQRAWQDHEHRVEGNIERVLQLFDDFAVKGTFFTLGWVAQHYTSLVRRIVDGGHELGSHGFAHVRADAQTPEQFRDDVRRTKAILEDAGGVKVRGYRAATFSIGARNPWAFDVLGEEGYAYSSSVYPVHHDLYGMPTAPRFPFYPNGDAGIEEYPITTVRIGGQNIPCGGGGYFRLLPYPVSRWALSRVNTVDNRPCIFYFHPWEIDAGQPRMEGISVKSRLRHYTNLARMEGRLRRLMSDFAWDRMDTVFLAGTRG